VIPWWGWLVGAAGVGMLALRPRTAGASQVNDDDQADDIVGALRRAGLQVVDLRAKAPKSYVVRERTPEETTAAVLHQTGFTWKPDNPLWPEVRSHFVVRRDGVVHVNHDPTQRLRYGSNKANAFGVTIEHEGNYSSSAGKWWEGERFGEDKVEDAPAQVAASRKLLEVLSDEYPIEHVYAHRQWDELKTNCPGPGIWKAVGQYAVEQLGLDDGGPGWHAEGGLAIPESWR